MKKNFYSYRTKHYYLKSIEINNNYDDLFSSEWKIYSYSKENSSSNNLQDEKIIGNFHFDGIPKNGRLKLFFNFENLTETGELKLIFSYILRWAFSQKNIYSLETIFPESKSYKEIYDFLAYKKEIDDKTFIFHAQQTSYTFLYLFLGMITGVLLGIITGNMKTGFIFSFIICGAIGIITDSNYKKQRNVIESKQ